MFLALILIINSVLWIQSTNHIPNIILLYTGNCIIITVTKLIWYCIQFCTWSESTLLSVVPKRVTWFMLTILKLYQCYLPHITQNSTFINWQERYLITSCGYILDPRSQFTWLKLNKCLSINHTHMNSHSSRYPTSRKLIISFLS